MNIYDITVEKANGEVVNLAKYKNKVLLVVNTATHCIFTPQYDLLQKLYDEYKEKGFEILDFPSNQFFNNTPESDEDIEKFCSNEYQTTFDRFSKIYVNGPDEHILYTYLKKTKYGCFSPRIKWNFTKFLIDREGNVVKRFGPNVKPNKIAKYIEKLI